MGLALCRFKRSKNFCASAPSMLSSVLVKITVKYPKFQDLTIMRQALPQFFRSVKIFYVILKYGLDRALFRLPFFRILKWTAWLNPFYWKIRRLNLSRDRKS